MRGQLVELDRSPSCELSRFLYTSHSTFLGHRMVDRVRDQIFHFYEWMLLISSTPHHRLLFERSVVVCQREAELFGAMKLSCGTAVPVSSWTTCVFHLLTSSTLPQKTLNSVGSQETVEYREVENCVELNVGSMVEVRLGKSPS